MARARSHRIPNLASLLLFPRSENRTRNPHPSRRQLLCACVHSWVSSMAEKQAHIAKLTAQIDELHQRCTQLKRSLGHSQVHEETDVASSKATASRGRLLQLRDAKASELQLLAAQLRSFRRKLAMAHVSPEIASTCKS